MNATLAYSTKEINRNFKIKVAGFNNDTKKAQHLGWGQRSCETHRRGTRQQVYQTSI